MEYLAHIRRCRDIAVCARAVVEEVDVDAVLVVLGADWRDRGNGFFCFGPAGFAAVARGHAAAVVDEEDRVEVAEEGVAGVYIAGVLDWTGLGDVEVGLLGFFVGGGIPDGAFGWSAEREESAHGLGARGFALHCGRCGYFDGPLGFCLM